MPNQESRIPDRLDSSLIRALVSYDEAERAQAATELPEALTTEEICLIAFQVGSIAEEAGPRAILQRERVTLYSIGKTALTHNNDLVTAKSATKALLFRADLYGFFDLQVRTTLAQRRVARRLIENEENYLKRLSG